MTQGPSTTENTLFLDSPRVFHLAVVALWRHNCTWRQGRMYVQITPDHYGSSDGAAEVKGLHQMVCLCCE